MHANVPVRFGRGRLDSLGNKGLAAYLIAEHFGLRAHVDQTDEKEIASLAPVAAVHRGLTLLFRRLTVISWPTQRMESPYAIP